MCHFSFVGQVIKSRICITRSRGTIFTRSWLGLYKPRLRSLYFFYCQMLKRRNTLSILWTYHQSWESRKYIDISTCWFFKQKRYWFKFNAKFVSSKCKKKRLSLNWMCEMLLMFYTCFKSFMFTWLWYVCMIWIIGWMLWLNKREIND